MDATSIIAPVEASGVLSQQEGPGGRPPRQPLQLTQCSNHRLPRLAVDYPNAHSLAVSPFGGLIRQRRGRGSSLRLGALACACATAPLCPFTLHTLAMSKRAVLCPSLTALLHGRLMWLCSPYVFVPGGALLCPQQCTIQHICPTQGVHHMCRCGAHDYALQHAPAGCAWPLCLMV